MSTVRPLDVMSETEYARVVLRQYSGKELHPNMTIAQLFGWHRFQMATAFTLIQWNAQVQLTEGIDRDAVLTMTVQQLLDKVGE